ncbi:MAG: DUF501 domain-containing protein [Actinomycetaceae bacterium]|nr:DUF501 domain-containing protein [Actinomycetaceae bacterium]
MDITEASDVDMKILERQLGRVPRGVLGIAARCVCGAPLVVATSPRLPDGSPFPTLFHLSHPGAVKGCSVLESNQWMEVLNEKLREDDELAEQYRRAHREYIAQRESYEVVPEISDFSAGGMPDRVKCLHALLAHTLAAGEGANPMGDLAEKKLAEERLWERGKCTCRPGETPADFEAEND